MNRAAAIAVAAALAAPACAADAFPRPAELRRASGRILKSAADVKKGPEGRPLPKAGRLTVADDAGHLEDYLVDARTQTTCDGVKAVWDKAAVPGACDRAVGILYQPKTNRVAVLELKTARALDAEEAKTRPNITGEIAATDVLAGKISVRLGGGATLDLAVPGGAKILCEAESKPAQDCPLEALKVGDAIQVRTKDWKIADELRVRAAAR
jgi:hypothetical protein